MRKVRDVWEWLNCMHDTSEGGEFGGGRFSEVANVLQVWDFQSVTRALSALGSVSASRSVRSRECVRFSECPLREVLLYLLKSHELA